jgi:dTDP-4-dehydrorhamnose reductase
VILVTGASGFLGWYVAYELRRRGASVAGTSRDGAGLPDGVTARALDLSDGGDAAAELVHELRPRVVLHLAALASVSACHREPAVAKAVNGAATDALAQAAADVGSSLLYSSTDLVFDGTAAPYGEDACPTPVSVYAETKADGERVVLARGHTVVRVPLLYGLAGGRGSGFTDRFVNEVRAGRAVTLYHDQYRTPAEVGDAASLLCDLAEKGRGGVVHLGGPERISRLELGLALARALGLDERLCVSTAAPGGLPPDSSLSGERLAALVGRGPVGVEAGCRSVRERAE